MIGRCETCKHWRETPQTLDHIRRGFCERIPVVTFPDSEFSTETVISFELGDAINFETLSDFGCTLHEPKDATP